MTDSMHIFSKLLYIRAGGRNFIMPRPVADEAHDFLGNLVENHVEFEYPYQYQNQKNRVNSMIFARNKLAIF